MSFCDICTKLNDKEVMRSVKGKTKQCRYGCASFKLAVKKDKKESEKKKMDLLAWTGV